MMEEVNNPVVYRKWDDGFTVRRMTSSDARLAQSWYSKICPTARDLELALSLYPADSHGFYVGEYKGQVVASAIRIPVAEGVYYGSYYYVVPECRRFGFGRRVRDDVAAPHVGSNILAIDAHDNLLEMNKRHGYTEGFKVSAYCGVPRLVVADSVTPSTHTIKQVKDVALTKVLAYDDQCFVRPKSEFRRKLLEKFFSIEGGESVVAVTSDDDVIGFGCRRPTLAEKNHVIGPLYADRLDVARDLLTELVRGIPGENVLISICLPNGDAVSLMESFGLKEDLHMIRMHLNGDPHELKDRVFALTSIDICGF